jgi:hypothetical protein
LWVFIGPLMSLVRNATSALLGLAMLSGLFTAGSLCDLWRGTYDASWVVVALCGAPFLVSVVLLWLSGIWARRVVRREGAETFGWLP